MGRAGDLELYYQVRDQVRDQVFGQISLSLPSI